MPEVVRLTFEERSFSVEALQKAVYRGLSSLTAEFDAVDGKHICTLIPNSGVTAEAFSRAVEEFRKDALDYQLRAKLSVETESVRNLILGIAFSRTGLQGSE